MGGIVAIFIVGIVTWGIYRMFELFARRKERMAIIEKLGSQAHSVDIEGSLNQILFSVRHDNSSWALRISLLLIGIGLGALIAFFIQHTIIADFPMPGDSDWHIRNEVNEIKAILNLSCIAIFGGAGLLTAYLIENKKSKE